MTKDEKIKKLERKIELLENELSIRNEINDVININMDREVILSRIVDALLEHMKIDSCQFALIDENDLMNIYEIRFSKLAPQGFNRGKANAEYYNNILKNWHPNYKETDFWACEVAREKKEMYLPDLNPYKDNAIIKAQGLVSLYFLPLFTKEKIYGTIMFVNYVEQMNFTDDEKELIRSRTSFIAKVFENFELYGKIKKQKELLEIQQGIINEDLMLAKRIQETLLPQNLPKCNNFEISTLYLPMYEVGGDYFDFHLDKSRNSLGIIITDASGHGVSAAFITSMIKIAFTSEYVQDNADKPGLILNYINNVILDKTAGNFVTAMYAYFDFNVNTLKLVCAGHNPLYLIRDNEILEYHPRGRILGLMDNVNFELNEIEIKQGDRFFFYTDGLTEAVNDENEEFESHLKEVLISSGGKSCNSLKELIFNKLCSFTNRSEHFDDDIALIICDVN